VRAVAGSGRVVGEPGPAVAVEYADRYPPGAPTNLLCLPEGRLVRLRWDGAPEAAAYRVFRQVGNGIWAHVVDALHELEYEDSAPPPGNLTYAVKTVDAAGNESPPATCTTVVAGLP
jgi:hypothetical protein